MTNQKRYIHDRLVLLILTISIFVTALTIGLIVWNISSARNEGYIIQYRPNLGLSAFKKGSRLDIASFGLFSVLVLIFHFFLSMKVYSHRRNFSIFVLGTGLLLIVLSLVISNALLLLR
jgi:hypothetical protein